MFIEHSFLEVMSWKMQGWEIPSSIHCIIRATDLKTKKTEEYVYSKPAYADKKIMQLMDRDGLEITVADRETIHNLLPDYYLDE